MAKYRSRHNYKPLKSEQETTIGVSMVHPDQSYTIKELMELNGQGINVSRWKNGYYDGDIEEIDMDDDFPLSKIQYLDLVEQAEQIDASAEMLYRAHEANERKQKKLDVIDQKKGTAMPEDLELANEEESEPAA